ncbi:hypothetical protein [Massilia sp. CF038]|uniref:hypothetical protein n=1 Tax=Massilia sp. CF038 TaxID=1881045 RepID=UPI000934971D|nr:hypothetical protein [Massilia sp. CF038]
MLTHRLALAGGAHRSFHHANLRSLPDKLRRQQIGRLEILWMDPQAGSRNAITPAVLERLFFRKLVLQQFERDPRALTLADALAATELSAFDLAAEDDVRWALKFYPRGAARPILSIYLAGDGRTGSIGHVRYSFNRPLLDWLEQSAQGGQRRRASQKNAK